MSTTLKLIAGAFAFATLALSGTAPSPAAAETFYPWCLRYSETSGGGAINCGFDNYAQCRATLSGMSGSCYENPAYPVTAVRPKKKRRAARN